MNKITNYIHSFYNKENSHRGQMFSICMILCTLVGIIATFTTAFQDASIIVVVTTALVPIGTMVLFFWGNKTLKYHTAGMIVAIVFCDILIPIIFFLSGGIRSGMLLYIIVGAVIIFLLLADSTKDVVIMIAIYIFICCVSIIVSYFHPSLVIQIEQDYMVYIDIIVGFIITTMLIISTLWYNFQLYKNEQKKVSNALKAKDEFLANMSHEVRTPLNAIIGISEIQLKNKSDLPETTTDDIAKIHASGTMLLQIINDILDISKIGSGTFSLSYEEYNIASLINDTVQMNKVRIGSKNIVFEVKVAPDIPSVLYGDELRIRQILNNFLSNAFKYTEEGSVRFEIACEQCLEKANYINLKIKIADSGIGIKEEDIPALFDKYSKFDDERNIHIEGTGLGLAITKELINMMDGDVKVSSVYGEGSIFEFEFPQMVVDSSHIGEKLAKTLSHFKYKDYKSTSEKRVHNSFAGKRALLVDDIDVNLYIAREMLLPYELEIDCVESGKEAIDAIRNEKVYYDIIFMDHMMPGIDGLEATRIIREEIGTEYAKNIPIVALTANAVVGKKNMFLEEGFQDFLSKPMDLDALDEVVNRWL